MLYVDRMQASRVRQHERFFVLHDYKVMNVIDSDVCEAEFAEHFLLSVVVDYCMTIGTHGHQKTTTACYTDDSLAVVYGGIAYDTLSMKIIVLAVSIGETE